MQSGGNWVRLSAVFLAAIALNVFAADQCINQWLSQESKSSQLYKANYQGVATDVKRELVNLGQEQWRLTQSLDMLLAGLEETSLFRVSGVSLQSLQSQRYSYAQTGLGARSYQVEVDQQGSRVRVDYKGQTSGYPSALQTLDQQSHILQLQLHRACDANRGDRYTFNIATRKGMREYSYDFVGEKTINLPRIKGVRVEIWQRVDKSLTDTLWLAPEMGYRMIRFEHRDDRDTSELLIKL